MRSWIVRRLAVGSIAGLGGCVRKLKDVRNNLFGKTLRIWANKNNLIVFRHKNQ